MHGPQSSLWAGRQQRKRFAASTDLSKTGPLLRAPNEPMAHLQDLHARREMRLNGPSWQIGNAWVQTCVDFNIPSTWKAFRMERSLFWT